MEGILTHCVITWPLVFSLIAGMAACKKSPVLPPAAEAPTPTRPKSASPVVPSAEPTRAVTAAPPKAEEKAAWLDALARCAPGVSFDACINGLKQSSVSGSVAEEGEGYLRHVVFSFATGAPSATVQIMKPTGDASGHIDEVKLRFQLDRAHRKRLLDWVHGGAKKLARYERIEAADTEKLLDDCSVAAESLGFNRPTSDGDNDFIRLQVGPLVASGREMEWDADPYEFILNRDDAGIGLCFTGNSSVKPAPGDPDQLMIDFVRGKVLFNEATTLKAQ